MPYFFSLELLEAKPRSDVDLKSQSIFKYIATHVLLLHFLSHAAVHVQKNLQLFGQYLQ